MSRTRRHIPNRANGRQPFLRHPVTKGSQTAEHYAALEMEEAGFKVPHRARGRANPKSGKIPDVRHDIMIAARNELDHHKPNQGFL